MTTTFMDKVSIISELSRGATKESLARVFSITEDDVNTIELHHSIIVEVAHYMNISQDMPLLGGHYPHMENILFSWLADRARGKVTHRALSEKAREIVDITGERPKFANASAFTGTEGWVRAFKARYRNIPINQRKGSSEYDEDVQAEPIPLSTDEIKLELGFEPEPEVIQSQNFDHRYSTVDDGEGVLSATSQPADSNEIFSSSPEEHMATQQAEIESSQIDERPMQERSTAINKGENSPSDTFDDSLPSGKSSRKRQAASIDEPSIDRPTEPNSDEDSLSQDFDDSAPLKKRRRTSEKILVQTKAGIKTVTLQEYKEEKVIRMFKPLLKFAKDSQWTSEDVGILNNLYSKSLRSCGGKQPKQQTITTFFRKKK